MLLHSWFRTVPFLASAVMLNPIMALFTSPSDWHRSLRFRALAEKAENSALIDEPIPETDPRRSCMAVLESRSLHQNQPDLDAAIPEVLPADVETVLADRGVTLYRQTHDNYDNAEIQAASSEMTTLIYAVDLSQGAALDLAGAIAIDPSDTDANLNANLNAAYDTERDPHVPPRSLVDHWQAITETYPDRAFAAINGQFFGSNPVRLAFPLKANGEIISGGYAGADEYDGEKLMLAIDGQTATIEPFPEVGSPDNPLFSDLPDLIVGLHPCADKGRDRAVGRTFAGIADRDHDGQAETILILAASHATQVDAILTLQRFGAIAMVMLDGGGSTQTIALGETYLTSSDRQPRAIPHAIGLLRGTAPREDSDS